MDILERFSKGLASKERTVREAGLRDYSELLPALGRRGLPLPGMPEPELRAMTDNFVRLLRESDCAVAKGGDPAPALDDDGRSAPGAG